MLPENVNKNVMFLCSGVSSGKIGYSCSESGVCFFDEAGAKFQEFKEWVVRAYR